LFAIKIYSFSIIDCSELVVGFFVLLLHSQSEQKNAFTFASFTALHASLQSEEAKKKRKAKVKDSEKNK
jgi:hypothetical protein